MTAGLGLAHVLVLAGGYLLGSIPFGLILTHLAGFGDIRKIGSGNIGATNVLRTGNKALALATLLLDGGKGAVAVLVARALTPVLLPDAAAGPGLLDLGVLAGAAAIIGHLFPVWLKFKGGKGVATGLGTLLAINWLVGAAACLTWLVVAFLFRYSSLSALLAFAFSPVYAYFLGDWAQVLFAVLATVLVWVRHHENIRRLLRGEEPKIGRKKTT